jgi:transposase InsO family protein
MPVLVGIQPPFCRPERRFPFAQVFVKMKGATPILDDFSRYLICCEIVGDMTGPTLSNLVQKAVEITGMQKVSVQHKVKLLSDNGSGYISKPFNEYLDAVGIKHLRLLVSNCSTSLPTVSPSPLNGFRPA